MKSRNDLFKRHARRNFIIYFFCVFFLTSAVLCGSILFAYSLGKRDYLQRVMSEEMFHLRLAENTITEHFATVLSDLIFLSRQNELNEFIKNGSPNLREAVQKELLEFSRLRGIYDQIRFIDMDGMEIFRINLHDGEPVIIAKDSLQSKKHRYYFRETISLEYGQVYVSPFDLNLEGGVIEQPIKPVIRLGIPVFDDDGVKRGIIVLNYLGNTILKILDGFSSVCRGNLMMVNSEGYWLYGSEVEKLWGFMYKGGTDYHFENKYPMIWREIAKASEYQAITGEGVFTSVTLRPLMECTDFLKESVTFFSEGVVPLFAREYHWKVISRIPENDLQNALRESRSWFLFLGAFLVFFSGIMSAMIAQFFVRRKMHRAELEWMANYDNLTDLPNRSLFLERLNQVLLQGKRDTSGFALLFIDLDGFKAVNDTHGHKAGDELLIQVAQKLLGSVRKSDTVARLGGDEFTVILKNLSHDSDAEKVAGKIIRKLSEPFDILGQKAQIGASVGICIFTGEEELTAEQLIKKADEAMYEAKQCGKNQYRLAT